MMNQNKNLKIAALLLYVAVALDALDVLLSLVILLPYGFAVAFSVSVEAIGVVLWYLTASCFIIYQFSLGKRWALWTITVAFILSLCSAWVGHSDFANADSSDGFKFISAIMNVLSYVSCGSAVFIAHKQHLMTYKRNILVWAGFLKRTDAEIEYARLQQLFDSGVITEEEFNQMKPKQLSKAA